MPTYEINAPAVALIGRESDEESLTVVGPFRDLALCADWAARRGLDALTHGVHKMSGHLVMPPDYSERALTGRFVGGFHRGGNGKGLFRGGSGMVTPLGERRDGVPTIVVVRVPERGGSEPGASMVTVGMGIFESSQDAKTWMHRIDSYYPRVQLSQRGQLRPVLTPDQFSDRVDEFRLKGQIA